MIIMFVMCNVFMVHVFLHRYASLRRQLLIDPHVPKDGSNSPDPVIDNPLSQNPGRISASSVCHFLLF